MVKCKECGKSFKIKPLNKLHPNWKARKCTTCMPPEKSDLDAMMSKLKSLKQL